jgi:hypothetical protein
MKPYPFSLLNHLTVPSAIRLPPLLGSGDLLAREPSEPDSGMPQRVAATRVAAMRLVTYECDSGALA